MTDSTPARPPSPLHCAICQDHLSPSAATLSPCTHIFDLSCLRQLLDQPGEAGRKCPLCRARILDYSYNIDIRGTPTPPAYLRPHSFQHQSQNDVFDPQVRVEQLRRIHRYPDFRLQATITQAQAYSREGPKLIHAYSSITLQIHQSPRSGTSSFRVIRDFEIKEYPAVHGEAVILRNFEGLERDGNAVYQARREVSGLLADVGIISEDFRTLSIVREVQEVPLDERGFGVRVKKTVSVEKRTPNEIKISRITELNEEFLTTSPSINAANDNYYTREERGRAVSMARAEFKVLIDFVREAQGDMGMFAGFRGEITDVDEAGWGIEDCEYCNGGWHANGACEVRWGMGVVASTG